MEHISDRFVREAGGSNPKLRILQRTLHAFLAMTAVIGLAGCADNGGYGGYFPGYIGGYGDYYPWYYGDHGYYGGLHGNSYGDHGYSGGIHHGIGHSGFGHGGGGHSRGGRH